MHTPAINPTVKPTATSPSRPLSRRASLLAMAACALPSGLAQAEPGVGAAELLIGQTLSLQGGKNAHGVAAAEAIDAVFAATNAQGGVNGRRLVLKTLDDAGDSQQAAAHARRLVAEGAYILFGGIEGGPCTAVAAVATETRVPYFGPMAGSPGLRRPHKDMVFPVRAEHRDEFRQLLIYGRSLGLKTAAFVYNDSDVGREHLANVRLLCQELGMELKLALALKAGAADAELALLADQLVAAAAGLCFNHGSSSAYAKIVRRVRTAESRTLMMAVNSGSSELARSLGPLAHGMVFTQVMPSPWERKNAITRDYQELMRKARPDAAFSYSGLEGYVTARALVLALRAAGFSPTRASFVAGLNGFKADLGNLRLQYRADLHEGLRHVDLAIYSREGRFIH